MPELGHSNSRVFQLSRRLIELQPWIRWAQQIVKYSDDPRSRPARSGSTSCEAGLRLGSTWLQPTPAFLIPPTYFICAISWCSSLYPRNFDLIVWLIPRCNREVSKFYWERSAPTYPGCEAARATREEVGMRIRITRQRSIFPCKVVFCHVAQLMG